MCTTLASTEVCHGRFKARKTSFTSVNFRKKRKVTCGYTRRRPLAAMMALEKKWIAIGDILPTKISKNND